MRRYLFIYLAQSIKARATFVKKTNMAKTTPKPNTAAKKTDKTPSIVKVTESLLDKLKTANLDLQLQADITWCLGSYGYDQNPVGLYDIAAKALELCKAENSKKTKGFTAKLITDIEKALAEK